MVIAKHILVHEVLRLQHIYYIDLVSMAADIQTHIRTYDVHEKVKGV